MESNFLSVDELAGKLNVPISWIYARSRQTGPDAMPKIKMGKYCRFEFEKVLTWIQAKNQAGN